MFDQLKHVFDQPLPLISFPREKEKKTLLMHKIYLHNVERKEKKKTGKNKNKNRMKKKKNDKNEQNSSSKTATTATTTTLAKLENKKTASQKNNFQKKDPKNSLHTITHSSDEELALPTRSQEKVHKWPTRNTNGNKHMQNITTNSSILKNQEEIIPKITQGFCTTDVNKSCAFIDESKTDSPSGKHLNVSSDQSNLSNVSSDQSNTTSGIVISSNDIETKSSEVITKKTKWKNECLQIASETNRLAEEALKVMKQKAIEDTSEKTIKDNKTNPPHSVTSSRKRRFEQMEKSMVLDSKIAETTQLDDIDHNSPTSLVKIARIQLTDIKQSNIQEKVPISHPNTRSHTNKNQPTTSMNLRKRTPGLTLAQQEAKRKAKAIYKRGRKIEQERKAEKQRIDKQTPCPFFKKHGTCNYGDDCIYSHECEVERRQEVCKYYVGGTCLRGDKCLFMHQQWPCKYFHLKSCCSQGDKCRFSHAELTPSMREILLAKEEDEQSSRIEIEQSSKLEADNTINTVVNEEEKSEVSSETLTTESTKEKENKDKIDEHVTSFQFPSLYSDLT